MCRSREGKTLEESDKVKISSSVDGVYTLRLCELTEEDSGQYTIKAVNDAGQTSCTATLLVHGQLQPLSLSRINFEHYVRTHVTCLSANGIIWQASKGRDALRLKEDWLPPGGSSVGLALQQSRGGLDASRDKNNNNNN